MKYYGGAQAVFPADVNDTNPNMDGPGRLNLAQGGDYLSLHEGQHGGAAVSLANSAPPGYTGMLDDSLRGAARIGVLDTSMGDIQGMSDQAGGARRRRKGKKSTRRKGKKSTRRKGKKSTRRGKKGGRRSRRRQRGGAMASLEGAADVSAPGMLLSPSQEAQALNGMNPEWKLATDPNSFNPLN